MPIPFIIAGVAAGALGIHEHRDAKERNERAQSIAAEASENYNKAKASLEKKQKSTEKRLEELGYSKKKVVDGSIKRFLQVYEQIKTIELRETTGLNEISKFTIDQQGALQLQQMTNIYQSAFSSGVAGAAAGTAVALAAGGSLSLAGSLLSGVGTWAAMGELGIAASCVGSAATFAFSATPLSAIAVPVVLFTGISSNMKASENLEKAKAMRSESEAAVEKMLLAETQCAAIAERSDMLNDLLKTLNVKFSECITLLDKMVSNKRKQLGRPLSASDFCMEEKRLIAITRSLAGAVKAVIDTPILDSKGELCDSSQTVCNDMQKKLPVFEKNVQEARIYEARAEARRIEAERAAAQKAAAERAAAQRAAAQKAAAERAAAQRAAAVQGEKNRYGANEEAKSVNFILINNKSEKIEEKQTKAGKKAASQKTTNEQVAMEKENIEENKTEIITAFDVLRNIIAIVAGIFVALKFAFKLEYALVVGSSLILLIMNNNIKKFSIIKHISHLAFVSGFCIWCYNNAAIVTQYKLFVLTDILLVVVTFFIFAMVWDENSGNFRKILAKIFCAVLCVSAAVLLFKILHAWVGIAAMPSIIIVEIVLFIFLLFGVCII